MSATNSVIFNGAEIRYNDTRRDEAGVFNRVHIAFKPSEPVMQAMGWDEFPGNIPSGKLCGRLSGTHIVFSPTDKALQQHEMQFGFNEVRDFAFTSETNDEGVIIGRTIRCTIVTAEKVAAVVEHWLSVVGEASAVAKVGYTVQQMLPGTEFTVSSFVEPAAVTDYTPAAADNLLNIAGSGRERKKRTRGEQPAFIDQSAPSAEEAAAVEQQIAESLQ